MHVPPHRETRLTCATHANIAHNVFGKCSNMCSHVRSDARGRQDKHVSHCSSDILDDNSNEAPRPDLSCGSNVAPTPMFAMISASKGPLLVAGDHCILHVVAAGWGAPGCRVLLRWTKEQTHLYLDRCSVGQLVVFWRAWIDASPQQHGEKVCQP